MRAATARLEEPVAYADALKVSLACHLAALPSERNKAARPGKRSRHVFKQGDRTESPKRVNANGLDAPDGPTRFAGTFTFTRCKVRYSGPLNGESTVSNFGHYLHDALTLR